MTQRKKKEMNLVTAILLICVIIVNSFCYNLIYRLESAEKSHRLINETVWRNQANRALKDLRIKFMSDVMNGIVDPHDETSMQKWASINIGGIRNGGETSDAFLINLANEKFIWDGSEDCQKPEFITDGRYMKDEAEMHQDPALCQLVLNKMRQAYDTVNVSSNIYWLFDDSPELLEWVILPNDIHGFGGEYKTNGGIKNPNYQSYILVLGTQLDEITTPFEPVYNHMDAIKKGLIALFILILTISIFFIFSCIYKGLKNTNGGGGRESLG